jgi:hypothetical protein
LKEAIGPKKALNKLAEKALELADIIIESTPGAEPITEIKDLCKAAIKS